METTREIRIQLNGETKSFAQGRSIRELLDELFSHQSQSAAGKFAAVAVEVNSEIVPHDQFGSAILQDNDHVEVVTLVGGG